MSTHPESPNDGTAIGPDETAHDEYAVVPLADGGIVLYDTEADDVWIQSDEWCRLEDVQ